MHITRRQIFQASAASLVAAGVVVAARQASLAATSVTVAGYVVRRLEQIGIRALFGVPGATCDPLFAAAQDSSALDVVVTSSDLEAGYAADGHARIRGAGAVAVTYGVGTMSLLAPIGGAHAERSAVIVVNGGPSPEDLRLQRERGTLHTHSLGLELTDLALFRAITAYAGRADSAADVPRVVDEAIVAALTHHRPVYIEIAKNLWDAACAAPVGTLAADRPPIGTEGELAASVMRALKGAAKPAVLLGIEIQRYGLQDDVIALIGKLGLPWATTYLAKSVIPESTPGFAGVYAGERSLPEVSATIEGADSLLCLGCVMGRQYRSLVGKSAASTIRVEGDTIRIGTAEPRPVRLEGLIQALRAEPWTTAGATSIATDWEGRRTSVPAAPASTEPGLTYDEVAREVAAVLDESLIVVTDTSLSMYPAASLPVRGQGAFVCNAVWQAIGFSVGAAVGVGLAGDRRPLVICGDGGFQMTAQGLSTLAKHDVRAIVVVLDNGTYAIEQFLLDRSYFDRATKVPKPHLQLNRWDYVGLAHAMGVKSASIAATVAELRSALAAAKADAGPALISATLRPHDIPAELRA